MEKTVLAKSSSGDPYVVSFDLVGSKLIVRCSCKAGLQMQQCKHKRAVCQRSKEALFNEAEFEELNHILSSPEGIQLCERLQSLDNELKEIEAEKEILNSREKLLKRRMASLFLKGLS